MKANSKTASFQVRNTDSIQKRNNTIKHVLEEVNEAIFLLFVFFAPFTFFNISFTFGASTSQAGYSYPIDVFISALGFIPCFFLILFFHKESISPKLFNLLGAFLILTTLSFVAAAFQYQQFNGWYSTNTFAVVLRSSFYFFRFLCVVVYCYLCLPLINRKHLLLCFLLSFFSVLFVGVLQIGSMNNVDLLITINDLIAKTKLIYPASYVQNLHRIPLTTPEPAHTADVVFAYFLPVSSMIIIKKKKSVISILLLFFDACLLVEEYFTFSAEAYATFAFACILLMVFLYLRLFKERQWIFIVMFSTFIMVILLFILKTPSLTSVILRKISRTNTNYSGAERMSFWFIHIMTFLTHPFFGVGSGCTGFYAFQYTVNRWFLIASLSRLDLSGALGVNIGGPSTLWFLSSYGLVGCFIFFSPLIGLVKKSLIGAPDKIQKMIAISLITYVFISTFALNIMNNHLLPLVLFSGYVFTSKNDKVIFDRFVC